MNTKVSTCVILTKTNEMDFVKTYRVELRFYFLVLNARQRIFRIRKNLVAGFANYG